MSKQLPERPNLEQLKKQAKDLLDEIHGGSVEALTRAALKPEQSDAIAAFGLSDAQRVLAREYGFGSWPKLKLHVETRVEDAAEARLIEAALEHEPEVVETILCERPGLGQRSVFAAAALGDEARIARELEFEPAVATRKGGPRDWELILYVCFGRCGGGDTQRAAAVRALLARGANPNASWIHPAWPDSPQPPLYGATGVNNHPQVARVLLEAGADPNDCESRYHAAQFGHVACLEVLKEFGADFSGRDKVWGNTPLYFLFGAIHPPAGLRHGIRWLLENGADPNVPSYTQKHGESPLHAAVRNQWDLATIELLLKHGANPAARRNDGRTPYALAVQRGRSDVANLLHACGAPVEVALEDEFLGACARRDGATAREILARQPELVRLLSPELKRVVLEAARDGKAAELELMAELGFDLEVTGDSGERALHWAAWYGRAASVRVLVAHGAAIEPRDSRFSAPPIGWCAHGSLHCRNPVGEYAAVAETLLAAGADPRGVDGSAEVMAVIRRRNTT